MIISITIELISDSYENANKFIEKPRRLKPIQTTSSVVESWDLSSDNNKENQKENNTPSLQFEPDLLNSIKIKQERIELLTNTVNKLSERIGTDIIDEDPNEDKTREHFGLRRRYENSMNVNTLHYQRDEEFGKNLFYITNVRDKFVSIKKYESYR